MNVGERGLVAPGIPGRDEIFETRIAHGNGLIASEHGEIEEPVVGTVPEKEEEEPVMGAGPEQGEPADAGSP